MSPSGPTFMYYEFIIHEVNCPMDLSYEGWKKLCLKGETLLKVTN